MQTMELSGEPVRHKPVYFSMIPHLVDDLGLSPYAYRLYGHIKRRTGENGGECWENTRNIAKCCRMSAGKVSQAKKELENASLVIIQKVKANHGGYCSHSIKVNDIWDANIAKYSACSHSKKEYSSCEQEGSSGELKNNPIKNNEVEEQLVSRSSHPIPPPVNSANFPAGGNDDLQQLRTHPAIQAIKQVTLYFPPKVLYQRIIDTIGETPDIERLSEVYQTWVANGNNPKNYKGWLFDWYTENMYYLLPQEKFKKEDKSAFLPGETISIEYGQPQEGSY